MYTSSLDFVHRLVQMKMFSNACLCDKPSWKFVFLVILFHCAHSVPPVEVTIGAIFSPSPEEQVSVKAFELALEYVNNQSTILPSTKLKYIVNQSAILDPLTNIQKACYQIINGVTAIFAPDSSIDIKAVSTITSSLKIPIFSPIATDIAFAQEHNNFPFLLRMVPPNSVSTQAIADIFAKFFWKRLAILTSNTDFAAGGTVQFILITLANKWSVVTTEKFDAIPDATKLDVREQLTHIKEKGVRVVLLSCTAGYVSQIMKQAKELEMIQGWAWIVMDVALNVTFPIPDDVIGLLGIRPIINQGALNSIFTSKMATAGHSVSDITQRAVKRFDSVLVFAQGLHEFFQDGHSLSNEIPTCGSCKGDSLFKTHGEKLTEYLKQAQTNGVSHFLNFTSDGSPGISKFEVVNLQKAGWKTVGNWNSQEGLFLNASQRVVTWPGATTDIPIDTRYRFGNATLKILTILAPGFIQLKTGKKATDKDPYEGLCIELIKRLAKDMQFKYTLDFVTDGYYGAYDPVTKKWNGLVGQLVDKNYDMVLAPLTITETRANVIDFSKPYLDLGLSILMKIPEKPDKNIFGFVDPFSREVWICSFATMVTVAMISLLLDKISPNGYYGSVVHSELEDRCDANETDDKLDGLIYLNLTNSMWFSIGALLQQGGDVLPRSVSGRTVAAFWWAASMIFIATYTANLAAFLTFNRMQVTINSVEQLGAQMEVSYGTVRDSPIEEFFQNSILPSYNAMHQFMEARGTLLTSAAEAIQKVKNENFGFIFDSLFLVKETFKKPCDVFIAGKTFGHFGYGLAFQKNSPYTTRFSLEILYLRESGEITNFEDHWFKKQGDCSVDLSLLKPSSGQLSLGDMIGVLYCVYVGIAIGIIVLIAEWCVASYWDVDPTDPAKPRSWAVAMRRRMGRMWQDIKTCFPNKLKCCAERTISGRAKVTAVELHDNPNEERKKEEYSIDNKGYINTTDTAVHPFQVTE